jgi:hypothetical protein
VSAVTVIVKQAAESTEQSIREWAIAAGTVGATVVALYIGVWRERLRRPKLSLQYSGPDTGDAAVITVGRMRWTSAYVRLRVTAPKRRAAAEGVEVMVVDAREIKPRSGFPRSDGAAIEGQLLAWSNSDPTNTRLTIPPGIHRHIDLIRVDKVDTASGGAAAYVQVSPVPSDGRHGVKSGKFELELAVGALNANARRYRVEVSYDGEWGDNVWEHLSVEPPQLVR